MAETLGNVAIQVSANLDQLAKDLVRARQMSSKGAGDASKAAAAASKNEATQMRAVEAAATRLAGKYDKVRSATATYAKEVNDLNLLMRTGNISGEEYAKVLGKIERQHIRTTTAGGQAAVALEKWGQKAKTYASVAGAAIVAAGVYMVKQSLDSAMAIKDQSQQLGIGVEALQEWNYAAIKNGMSTEEFSVAVSSLGRSMARASQGVYRDAELFSRLGISLKDTTGRVKSTTEILPELADKLNMVGDANQKAAALQVLFGESARKIVPLLDQGSEGINNLRNAARELGIVLSEEQIQNVDETANKLKALKTVLSAEISAVVAANSGAILGLASALGSLTNAIIKFMSANPEAALAIVGGLLGARFGPIGAAVGAAGGLLAGNQLRNQSVAAQDESSNLEVRRQRLFAAGEELGKRQKFQESGSLFNVRSTSNRTSGASLKSAQAEYERQTKLYEQAVAASRKTGAAGGGINLGNFTVKPPKGGAGGRDTSQRDRLRGLRDDKAFADAIASLQTQYLRETQEQVSDISERANIERQILAIEKDRFTRALELEGPGGTNRFNAAEVELQKQKFDQVQSAKLANLAEQERQALLDDSLNAQIKMNGFQLERLGLERGASRTAEEARRVALEMLDITQSERREAVKRELLSTDLTDAERRVLEARLQQLDAIDSLELDETLRRTQNALEAYVDSLPQTLGEIQERQMQVQADFFRSIDERTVAFADGFAGALGNAAGALARFESPLSVLTGLLQDLAAQFTEEFITRPATDFFKQQVTGGVAEDLIGGNAGLGGLTQAQENAARAAAATQLAAVGGNAGAAAAALSALGGAAAPAGTGLANIGVSATIAQTGIQAMATAAAQAAIALQAIAASGTAQGVGSLVGGSGISFSTGGMIEGAGTGQSDSVRAFGPRGRYNLSRGEFITNAAATRAFRPLLETINAGRIPSMGALFAPMMNGGGQTTINVPVTVSGGSSDPRQNRKIGRQIGAEASRMIAEARGYNK